MIERRNWKLVTLGVVAGLGLSACATYNPEDNDFDAVGIITDIGDQSLKVKVTDIILEEGKARKVLEVGDTTQFHDNCYCHGFLDSQKKYGTILSYTGVVIDSSEIDDGSCVRVTGQMREESSGGDSNKEPDLKQSIILRKL